MTAVARDWVEPNVCTDENLAVSKPDGLLELAPWSVPRLVQDVMAKSTADGQVIPQTALPGRLLIDQQLNWINNSPLNAQVLIRVTRPTRLTDTERHASVALSRERHAGATGLRPPVRSAATTG